MRSSAFRRSGPACRSERDEAALSLKHRHSRPQNHGVNAATTTHETEFKETTLDNGLRVVTSEVPHVRSVSVGIPARRRVEARVRQAGRGSPSHLIEHMVFKRTFPRPLPGEIRIDA